MGDPAVCDPKTTNCPPPPPPTSNTACGGLKQQWDLKDPPSLDESGASEHVKQFTEKFKGIMAGVNQCLQYTKCTAVKEKHESMAADRDFQYSSFQTTRAQVSSKSDAEAKGQITSCLGQAQAVAGKANTFKQVTETSVKAWQAKEPSYTKSEQNIEELVQWDDKKFEDLSKANKEIRPLTNVNKYDEAVTKLDQHLPKLKPVHDEYVKQKAAKEKYDAEYKKIKEKLPTKSKPAYKKLATSESEIAEQQKQMDAAVQAKDYVKALGLIGNLSVKAEAYSTAVTQLETHKQAYEKTLAGLKDRLAKVPQSTFQKLAKQKEDITTTQGQMETAAKDGDYERAEQLVNQVGAKLDALEVASAPLEKAKKEYDDAKVELDNKLKTASQTDENAKMEPLTKELAAMQNQIDAAVKAEDFNLAATQAKKLSAMIDEYKKLKKDSVYEIQYPAGQGGVKYTGTAVELTKLRLAIAAHAAKVLARVQNRADTNQGYYQDFSNIWPAHPILAEIIRATSNVMALGGASLESIETPLNKQTPAINEAERALSIPGNEKQAEILCQKAWKAVNDTSEAINSYLSALDKGSGRLIVTLEVIKGTCFAIGAAAGAAAGGAVAAGAAFGALESLSDDVAKNLIMDQKKTDGGDILLNAVLSAVVGAAGNKMGASKVVSEKARPILVKAILTKGQVKTRVVTEIVVDAVEGGLTNVVQQSMQNAKDELKGKHLTFGDWAKTLLIALIAGGLAKRIVGNSQKDSQFCKTINQMEWEELQKGEIKVLLDSLK